MLLSLLLPCAIQAHRLDEYLQAAQVVIEPGRVRLQLVLEPGIEVATQVLRHIDPDSDQLISHAEAADYIDTVQRDLMLSLDDRVLQLKLDDSEFDTPAELRSGSGRVRLVFSGAVQTMHPGVHRLVFENRHLGAVSVYLFNAMQPDLPGIRIGRQQRNSTQSKGEIEFVLAGVASAH